MLAAAEAPPAAAHAAAHLLRSKSAGVPFLSWMPLPVPPLPVQSLPPRLALPPQPAQQPEGVGSAPPSSQQQPVNRAGGAEAPDELARLHDGAEDLEHKAQAFIDEAGGWDAVLASGEGLRTEPGPIGPLPGGPLLARRLKAEAGPVELQPGEPTQSASP